MSRRGALVLSGPEELGRLRALHHAVRPLVPSVEWLGDPRDLETPVAPCDAAPDGYDVAVAIDRLERMTTLRVSHVPHRWAGLRSFVADRTPVVGRGRRGAVACPPTRRTLAHAP